MNNRCYAREVEDLEEAFALVVSEGTFVFAVRRGLIPPEDVLLLDRLLKRARAARLEYEATVITA